tara:strand:+ start:1786 stop:1998 length:213 start_codon:yes stop_codon:yes gene_type:complete
MNNSCSTQNKRFEKLYKFLESNEEYETSCARKAKLFDAIVAVINDSESKKCKISLIEEIIKSTEEVKDVK